MTSTRSTAGTRCRRVFDLAILVEKSGFLLLRASGRNAWNAFKEEGGGHRWQRVPPTEKRGRVHTSTVTVAVLQESQEAQVKLQEKDLKVQVTKGSGPGGQNRSKVETAIQITHLPTGIRVRAEDSSSKADNLQKARALLLFKLHRVEQQKLNDARDADRRQQVGSGMRGDKIRTIQEQNGRVTNHKNDKKMRLKDYLRGGIREIL